MMAQDQGRNGLAVAAQRRKRALAMIGMKPRCVCFALSERSGSHPGRDRNRKFADIMRVRRPADGPNVRGRKPDTPAGSIRKRR